MVKIGDTLLKHGLCLAPMAGYTDRGMRTVCHSLGCEYSVTEMVSAKAVVYNDKKTLTLAGITREEGPTAIQIFGNEPDTMAKAAEVLSTKMIGSALPVAIDINMGCPVQKIYGNGEGSALMRDPELIYRIVKAVSSSIQIPVTVKLRLGIDQKSINVCECAVAAEDGGASMICIHGRTRVQMYSGNADMEAIANVKKYLHIPLFANGDIATVEGALDVFRKTGADGIMIGRGAVGDPYLFSAIRCALQGQEFNPPDIKQRCDTALWQLRISILDRGEGVAVREARKQIALYLHSFRGAAQLRAMINQATTYDDVEKILTDAVAYEKEMKI